MAKRIYTEEYIADIATAIREKNGSVATYTTAEMPAAVRALIWQGTQAEYDALTSYNSTTLYIIVESEGE